jgi:hypothetical protein
MNLLARLLLEIRIVFLFLLEDCDDSRNTFLRHSGILASTEGVVSGSPIRYRLRSVYAHNFHQSIMRWVCLREPINLVLFVLPVTKGANWLAR